MVGHGTKISGKKKEAIAALRTSQSVEEAARVAAISTQELLRWMNQDPEFGAACRAARCAEYRQSMARLGQGATVAVRSIVQIMYHGKKASTRFKAARDVIRLAKAANVTAAATSTEVQIWPGARWVGYAW